MINIWIGTGRVVKDATPAKTKNGTPVCSFTLAVKRDHSDATDFIDVVAWNKLADFCGQQLRKGKLITVVGSLQMRDYEDKEGHKRREWEISAQKIQIAQYDDTPPDEEVPF